jgi:hypothetical protein
MASGGWFQAGLLGVGALLLACGGADQERRAHTRPLAPRAAKAEANRPPVIQRVHLEPREPVAGERVRAVVAASDPDGDPIRLGYLWRVGGRTIANDALHLELGSVAKGTSVEVTVTASDGRKESSSVQADVRVANRRPHLLGLRLDPPEEVAPGSLVVVTAQAEDPDEDRLDYSYQWSVNGRPVDEKGPSFSSVGLERGDEIQVRVVATDGDGESDPLESAPVRVANAPPKILSSPPSAWNDGTFRYTLEVRDPDGDRTLRYRLVKGPRGMTVDPVLGEITWTPDPSQAGRHPVEVGVEDAYGAVAAQRFELTVSEVTTDAQPDSPANQE